MNEQLKEIKRLHDLLKDNPFWLNFDIHLYMDVLTQFRQLHNIYFGSSDKTNPCYVMLSAIYHDFNAMISSEMYCLEKRTIDKVDSKIIIMLQTYLTLVHGLFDKRDLSEVFGYNCRCIKGNYSLSTLKAIYDEAKKEYYVVNVVPESKREVIIKLCEKELEKFHYDKTWWQEALAELKEGRKEVKKFWLFKS